MGLVLADFCLLFSSEEGSLFAIIDIPLHLDLDRVCKLQTFLLLGGLLALGLLHLS